MYQSILFDCIAIAPSINGLDAIAKRIRSLLLSWRPTATEIQGAVMIDVGQNININSSFQTKPGQQKSTTQTASNDFAKVASLCDCTDHSSFHL
jgi:hypothetical protein